MKSHMVQDHIKKSYDYLSNTFVKQYFQLTFAHPGMQLGAGSPSNSSSSVAHWNKDKKVKNAECLTD